MKAATLSSAAVTHANALSYAALATTNNLATAVGAGTPVPTGNGDHASAFGNGDSASNLISPPNSLPLAVDTVVVSEVSLPANKFFSHGFYLKKLTKFSLLVGLKTSEVLLFLNSSIFKDN